MASSAGQPTAASLLVLVFISLLQSGESANTELAIYNPIIGNYNSLGQFWCQPAHQPCEDNGQCCSGCCQSAVALCSARNEDCTIFENPCSQISCPMTTACAVLPSGQPYCVPSYDNPPARWCEPNCPSGYMCKIFSHVDPPYSKCIVDDPCGSLVCPQGQVCDHISGVSSWPVKCVPHPCNKIVCGLPGYTCRVKPNAYPLRGECVPNGPCAVIRCASWHVCVTVPGSYPPQGRCVPSLSDPCENIVCRFGTKCVTQPNNFPPRAMCEFTQTDITCSSVTCRPGYTCSMQIETYSRTPRPQCEPAHPCSYPHNPCLPSEVCVERLPVCFNKVPCPLVAECLSRNPCANTRCGRGYSCQLVQTYCNTPPCYPVAQCVLTSPCYSEVNPCKPYEVCTEQEVPCLVAPCAKIAVCKPKFW